MSGAHLVNRVRVIIIIVSFHSDLLLGTPQELKVMVYYSCLINLFQKCNTCGSDDVLNQQQFCGTCVRITQTCSSGHHFEWESQPKIGSIYGGNLLLSSAILFAGASPTQVLRVMSFLSCARISCLLYTSPSPRDRQKSRMPSSA